MKTLPNLPVILALLIIGVHSCGGGSKTTLLGVTFDIGSLEPATPSGLLAIARPRTDGTAEILEMTRIERLADLRLEGSVDPDTANRLLLLTFPQTLEHVEAFLDDTEPGTVALPPALLLSAPLVEGSELTRVQNGDPDWTLASNLAGRIRVRESDLPTATPTPTVMPTINPTITPTVTPTPTPTATPSPTPTPIQYILDNDSPSTASQGTWTPAGPVPGVLSYDGEWLYHSDNGATGDFFRWDFTGIPNGNYKIDVTFAASPSRSTQALYRIDHAGITDVVYPVSQQDGSVQWHPLGGPYNITNNTASVWVYYSIAGGSICADAVRLVPVTPTPVPTATPTEIPDIGS